MAAPSVFYVVLPAVEGSSLPIDATRYTDFDEAKKECLKRTLYNNTQFVIMTASHYVDENITTANVDATVSTIT